MTRKSINIFEGLSSIGLDAVGLNETILIKDFNGVPKQIVLKDKTNISSSSTIQDLLDLPDQWEGVNTIFLGLMGSLSNPLLDIPLNNSLSPKGSSASTIFSRSTGGSYMNKLKLLKHVNIDEPRFEKEGLLMEGSSENLLHYSENFNNAGWTKTNCVTPVESDQGNANPTGEEYLISLEDTVDNSYHSILSNTINTTAGTNMTFSIFCRENTLSSIGYTLQGGNSNGWIQGYFNMNTKTFTGSQYILSESYEELKNNWFRINVVFDIDTTTTTNMRVNTHNGTDHSYVGNGSSIDVWGAQLENMDFSTSYIRTSTSSETRGEDICYIEADNCPNMQEDWSMVCDFDFAGYNLYNTILSVTNEAGTTINEGVIIDNTLELYFAHSAISYNSNYTLEPSNRYRIIFSSNEKHYINGIFYSGGASTINYKKPTKINLGISQAGTNLFGHIKNFRIFNKVFTEIEALLV